MYRNIIKIIVISIYFQQTLELCVWEPMLTKNWPLCQFNDNCTANNSDDWIVLTRRKRHQYNAVSKPIPLLKPGSPELSHFSTVKDDTPYVDNDGNLGYQLLKSLVVEEFSCDNTTKYRTYDGSCNNLKNPNWGRADYEMIRLLKPRYSGKNGQPVKSVTGSALPNPRILSVRLFEDANKPSINHTLMFMQWGQIVAHDMAKSPSVSNLPLDCCSAEGQSSDICYPIELPQNDTFFGQYNQTCISMIRTKVINKEVNCSMEQYQISSVSQNFDASELYGSSLATLNSVRSFSNGLLDYYVNSNGEMFPKLSDNPEVDCNFVYPSKICFHSGDSRVNQNIQLTCLQTLLLREHNRVAKLLAELNPHWTDEDLFQESRRILIAEVQHITYNEYLPLLLGENYIDEYNLRPLNDGYTAYNDNINFATINSFTASVFRIYHSQIQGNISMYNSSGCPYRTLLMSAYLNTPGLIIDDENFDDLVRGLIKQPPQRVDDYFTEGVTNLLFQGDEPYGEDLESFDIQRGRDHGIPSYTEMRELCGLEKVYNFTDLLNDMTEKQVEALSSLYASVDDIDLFVGGTLEKLVEGSTAGPTFLCILGEQFVRKKYGDRFWYEHGNLTHSFTEEQLQDIRQCSLSRLICDNSQNITEIQPLAFLSPILAGNNISLCSDLPSVDLTKWKEDETN